MINNSKVKKRKYQDALPAFLMALPQFIGFLVFSLYPILWVLRLAWYDYDMVSMRFCGFDNFIRIFTSDKSYWTSVATTFEISFIKLLVEIPLSLTLAVFLKETIQKGAGLFRTVYFLPNIVSSAIMGVVFYFMFASYNGIINNILIAMGAIGAPIDWFAHKWTAMFVIMLASIWQGFGMNMLYFLAGLMNIPEEVYESAYMDGAGPVTKFFKITIPLLGPVLKTVLMLAIIGSIKMSDLVITLTNGQPAGETEVVMSYIYKQLFAMVGGTDGSALAQTGYASALGIVTAVIIALVTFVYNKAANKFFKEY